MTISKYLFCTGRVPGSSTTDYQCMTSQFTVSRDSGGIMLTCPACKTIHRMESLEAGQRVDVVTDRGIGDESFQAVVEGERLEPYVEGIWDCCQTDCGSFNAGRSRNCGSASLKPESCQSYKTDILF